MDLHLSLKKQTTSLKKFFDQEEEKDGAAGIPYPSNFVDDKVEHNTGLDPDLLKNEVAASMRYRKNLPGPMDGNFYGTEFAELEID